MASRNEPTPTKDSNEHGISRRQVLARGLVVAIGAAVGVTSALDNCFADRDASSGIKAALDEWRANRRNPYLNERFESLKKVASTGHPEALKAIVDEFLAKDSPKHQDKLLELIAPIAAEKFSNKAFEDYWINLFSSKEFSKPNLNNCWLAYSVFRAWNRDHRLTAVQDYALRDDAPLAYRMAALRSIFLLYSTTPSFIDSLIKKVPSVPIVDRGRFLEAVANNLQASLLIDRPPAKMDRAAIPGLMGLINQLDDELISQESLRRVGKIIADIVGSKTIFKNAAGWKAYLENRKTAEALKADGYAAPDEQTQYFFGVRGFGHRTCYVIDLSESMNQKIDISAAKKETTNTSDPGKETKKEADSPPLPAVGKPDPNAWLKDLPLDRIKTRLDAAKEALKDSLRKLPPGAKFSIVGFGDDGKILGNANRMIEATPVKVQAMCLAIDRLVANGQTNLHRGFELAFSFGTEGAPKPNSVLPIAEEAPDIIYVLSDGAATVDSYSMTKDGPRSYLFQNSENLSNSVIHGNIFMAAEIHLISIGQQENSTLGVIAKYNHCELVQVGK